MNRELSTAANLLGDPGRAAILLSLMGGIALPAGELAHIANVAPQTASEHLARLVKGRFLQMERQGRHRYYRLASPQVADAIEALLVLAPQPGLGKRAGLQTRSTRASTVGTLAYARTCYAHLAGWLGVQIASTLEERTLVLPSGPRDYTVTPSGRDWFAAQGIELAPSEWNRAASGRRCLDWTERRHHLAGPLGCALYRRLQDLRWVAPVQNTRAVRVTLEGKRRLWELLRIPIA